MSSAANADDFENFPVIEPDAVLKKCKPWRFPRLFTRAKTKALRFWEVGFDGENLVTRYGQITETTDKETGEITREDGKVQQTSKAVVPKSTRTLIEQSLQEGRRKYEDKCKENDATTDPDDAQQAVKPTLAEKYDPENHDWKNPNWEASPKLDGIRLKIFIKAGSIYYESRKKREIHFLTHFDESISALRDALITILRNHPKFKKMDAKRFLEIAFDGECCLPGEDFQTLISLVRHQKTKPDGVETVKFFLFDVILPDNKLTYKERFALLHAAYISAFDSVLIEDESGTCVSRDVILLHSTPVRSHEEVAQLQELFLSLSYEGLMLRDSSMLYESGRTKKLLKVKKWLDDEGRIADVIEGKGRMKGKAVFVVEAENGGVFNVTMAATMEQREEWFNDRESLIGKLLTYKYFEATNDGLPRFPVGVVIRDYE